MLRKIGNSRCVVDKKLVKHLEEQYRGQILTQQAWKPRDRFLLNHIDETFIFYHSIGQQYRIGLYFVYWIKYHQSTPVQTISNEIKQSVKTISNEIKNNLQWD